MIKASNEISSGETMSRAYQAQKSNEMMKQRIQKIQIGGPETLNNSFNNMNGVRQSYNITNVNKAELNLNPRNLQNIRSKRYKDQGGTAGYELDQMRAPPIANQAIFGSNAMSPVASNTAKQNLVLF